jgi:hypothetical protein
MPAFSHRAHPQQLALAIWVVAEKRVGGGAAESRPVGEIAGGVHWNAGWAASTLRRELVACHASALLDPRSVR